MSGVKKTLKKVAPIASIALPIAFPGLGAALGAALGAGATAAPIVGGGLIGGGLGAASGGGLKGALAGAATGGLAGGGASALSKGAGLSGAGANIAGKALTGASAGYQGGGDLKSALQGAGAGAALGGVQSGLQGDTFLGTKAGTTLDKVKGSEGLQGPTRGTGALGSATRGLSDLTSGIGVATGGGAGVGGEGMNTGGNNFSSLFSSVNNYMTNKDIQEELLQAQYNAQAQLRPFQDIGLGALEQGTNALREGFSYEDFQNSPAYQFQMEQGQKALQNQLAASGLGQSGAALKAAQEYGTGLASQDFSNEYNRWLQEQGALTGLGNYGYNAASGIGNVAQQIGGTNALYKQAQAENINKTLAQLLSGSGYL